jgi:hypothetical protein
MIIYDYEPRHGGRYFLNLTVSFPKRKRYFILTFNETLPFVAGDAAQFLRLITGFANDSTAHRASFLVGICRASGQQTITATKIFNLF